MTVAKERSDLVRNIVAQRPVSATFVQGGRMKSYSSGIMTKDMCDLDTVYRSITIVGYGSELVNGKRTPFWIGKNNMGTKWGEDGYFRIERGEGQTGSICGFVDSVTYPYL